MQFYFYGITVCSILLAGCCKKAPIAIDSDDCITNNRRLITAQNDRIDTFRVIQSPLGEYTYVQIGNEEQFNLSKPVFNPHNANELIFIQSNLSYRCDLYRYSLCSGEKKWLCGNVYVGSTLSWAENDWIAYDGVDHQVWMVKANGDSLHRVTNASVNNNSPSLSPDGSILSYYSEEGTQGIKIAKTDGTIFDSLPAVQFPYLYEVIWSNDNQYFTYQEAVGNFGANIVVYDYKNKRRLYQYYFDGINIGSYASGNWVAKWIENDKALLCYSLYSIFKLDIATGTLTYIKKSGNNSMYSTPSISPNGKWITIERTDRWQGDGDTVYFERGICLYLMRTDGSDEQRIWINK